MMKRNLVFRKIFQFLVIGAALIAVRPLCASTKVAWQQDSAWIEQYGAGNVATMLRAAEDFMIAGNHKRAAAIYERLEKLAVNDFNKANSMVLRADCLFADGKFSTATEIYSEALQEYASSIPFSQVISRLRELAEMAAAGEKTFLRIRDRRQAIHIYNIIIAKAGVEGIPDTLRVAKLHAEIKQPEEALIVYRELFRRFPGNDAALNARLDMAELLLEMAKTGDGDGRLVREARLQIDEFLRQARPEHPQRPRAETLQAGVLEQQAGNLLKLAEFYSRPTHLRPAAARRYLHNLQREYPQTLAAAQVEVLLARLEQLTPPQVEPAVVSATAAEKPVAATELTQKAPSPRRQMREKEPEAYSCSALISLSGVVQRPPLEPPAKAVSGHRRELERKDDVGRWLLPLEDLELPKEGNRE